MLREFAFSPEVFFPSAYGVKDKDDQFLPSADHGQMALTTLWKGIERGGVIRNLAGGQWDKHLLSNHHSLHARSRELLKQLRDAGRIVKSEAKQIHAPVSEQDWLTEAVASHLAEPEISQFFGTDEFCAGIKAEAFQRLPKGISKIPFCTPFGGGGCSVKVNRNVEAYLGALRPLIKYSRSLMFIDPYLDLDAPNYRDFMQLLRHIAAINPKVVIELHRQRRPAKDAVMPTAKEWHQRFTQVLSADPVVSTMKIDVFIWDEFHDRYLISNLMGLSVPYGFDTTTKQDATRWTLLSRDDADDVRSEFNEADPQRRRTLQRP